MKTRISLAAAAIVSLTSASAFAQQDFDVTQKRSEYDVTNFNIVPDGADSGRSDNIVTWLGIGVSLGVGASLFLDESLSDATDLGAGAEGRVIIGTHFPVALELGGVGTTNGLDTPDDNDALTSFGADARLRANFTMSTLIQPFIFGGVGWKRYDIVDLSDNEQGGDVEGEDDIMELPVGAGVALYWGNLMVDVRATWRPSFYADANVGDSEASAEFDEANYDNAGVGFNVGGVF